MCTSSGGLEIAADNRIFSLPGNRGEQNSRTFRKCHLTAIEDETRPHIIRKAKVLFTVADGHPFHYVFVINAWQY